MKNVVCDVSFLSEILEGSCSYLSVGLSSTGSFFSRAANVKLLQDMGNSPACFQKAFLPDMLIKQSGNRRSAEHSVPFFSFLFLLLTEMKFLLAKISVCNGCELFTLLWETGSVLRSVYSSAYESGHQPSLWKLSLV